MLNYIKLTSFPIINYFIYIVFKKVSHMEEETSGMFFAANQS